jgi:hypothetical protein
MIHNPRAFNAVKRLSMCTGKQRFDSRGEARMAISRMSRRRHRHDGIEAYACEFCAGFHVGRRKDRAYKS